MSGRLAVAVVLLLPAAGVATVALMTAAPLQAAVALTWNMKHMKKGTGRSDKVGREGEGESARSRHQGRQSSRSRRTVVAAAAAVLQSKGGQENMGGGGKRAAEESNT